MELYETASDYTFKQIKSFEKYCDDNFGTEIEINDVGANEYYALVCDLTWREVKKLRDYECMFRLDNGM